tara:strand:+ start:1101 stop:1304 length:204 start_codon:yes stop_codon:yes gene_type:complete
MAIDIDTAANEPKRVRVNEEGEAEEHSLKDLVAASEYEDKKTARTSAGKRPPFGIYLSTVEGGPLGR